MDKIIYYNTAKKIDHREGDVWEENGKQWTIKNGITQTITKFDEIRSNNIMPLKCPNCSKAMNTIYDKSFWRMRGMCINCVTEEDTQKMINGTYKREEELELVRNKIFALKVYRDRLEEFSRHLDSKQYVTEVGTIEDWSNQYNVEANREKLQEKIDQVDKLLNEFKKELDSV